MLQGQSPALRSSPAKQTDPAAIKWLEREQKQRVQRARPPGQAGEACQAPLPACLRPGGEYTLCPRRLGLGGTSGALQEVFPREKDFRGSWGPGQIQLGAGQAPRYWGPAKSWGGEGDQVSEIPPNSPLLPLILLVACLPGSLSNLSPSVCLSLPIYISAFLFTHSVSPTACFSLCLFLCLSVSLVHLCLLCLPVSLHL